MTSSTEGSDRMIGVGWATCPRAPADLASRETAGDTAHRGKDMYRDVAA